MKRLEKIALFCATVMLMIATTGCGGGGGTQASAQAGLDTPPSLPAVSE